MNVFYLTGGALTTVSAQLLRLAPGGSKVCVVEAAGNAADEALAKQVADLLSQARSSQLIEKKVQGYQIGALPDFRNKSYKLYFMG